MSQDALRVAGAVLVAVVCIAAGARMYSAHLAAEGHGGVRVPAGAASAPTPGALPGGGFDPTLPPVKIPERLPDFSLKDRDGKTTSIRAWSGKSLIINFWATWCEPCRREIPLLETLHSQWSGRGVAVIGIAVDHREQVVAFANEFKIPYPLLIGEEDALEVAAAFGVASPPFPFTVFTDRRGEVVALYVGELHQAEAALILSVLRDLDAEQVALPQARRMIAEGLQALAAARPG